MILRLAVVAVCLVSLAGCASSEPPKDSQSAEASPANPVTPAIYLKLMKELPDFSGISDANLITVGKSTCEVMAGKDGWLISVKNFTDHGFDAKQSGEAITYAVATYCPQLQVNEPVG